MLGCATETAIDLDDAAETTATPTAAPSFERCERCHAAIAAEHAGSLHAHAATDPLFVRELARVPAPSFCVGCHGADRSPPGLGCASCHGEGTIRASVASGRAPHPVAVDPVLATDASCASCHQFDFPGRPGERMHATIDEAHALLGEDRPRCLSCHGGEHGHAAAVSDAMLADAVRVTASARRDGVRARVRLTLRAAEVGHAVPTGDVYRRLEVQAWIAGAPRSLRTTTLARTFLREPDGLHEIGDDRLMPGAPRTVTLALPIPDGASAIDVCWRIEWHALPRDEAEREEIDEGWWRRLIAEGHLGL